jgi:hypothetical protein
MPLENYNQESNAAAFRWRACLGLAFSIVIGYFGIGLFTFSAEEAAPPKRSPGPPPKKSVAEVDLDIGARRQRVDDFCAAVPKPERFYFVKKNPPAENENLTYVGYFYRTERDSSEIMPVFSVWFNSNGWRTNGGDDAVFIKENKTVNISRSEFDPKSYRIYCTESFLLNSENKRSAKSMVKRM